MKVGQQPDSGLLQRQKAQLKDLAHKDEAKATQLAREGVDDLFTASERQDSAVEHRQQGAELSQESQRLRRNGRDQSRRGLERLADGSDRVSESFTQTEEGLKGLAGSLDSAQTASESKAHGFETAQKGLDQQGLENDRQARDLGKLNGLQERAQKLDQKKAAQADRLETLQGKTAQNLEQQTDSLADFLIAGHEFSQGTAVKKEGFEQLGTAAHHSVNSEALNDSKVAKELTQQWASDDQGRHQDTSKDLLFSSLWQTIKAKSAALNADYHRDASVRDGQSAQALSAQAGELKARATGLLQNARMLEQSGQCHVAQGQQMQCNPFTYCAGLSLERQGHAEICEAQRLKGEAQGVRQEAHGLSVQAEELNARAEDARARGDDFEVKSHGSSARAGYLGQRSTEHREAAVVAGGVAAEAGDAAQEFAAASNAEKALAQEAQVSGEGLLNQGFAGQAEALQQQGEAGDKFRGELKKEEGLNKKSLSTTAQAQKTVAQDISFLGRQSRLLHKVGNSQTREVKAQGKVQSGIDEMLAGLDTSMTAQQAGFEATQLLTEARDLELEGLRLQNRGQKMLLQARPKLSESAKLSAQSFSKLSKADREEAEAEQLVEKGNQKIAAAGILREKAAAYTKLADSASSSSTS